MRKLSKILSSTIALTAFGVVLTHCGGDDNGNHCITNADCAQMGINFLCNLDNNTCECLPSCAGKCCGDDGCGGTCENICPAGQTCNADSCACEGEQTCNAGDTRCMNDIVQTCDANATWNDTTDCTISNQVCVNGQCEAGTCTYGDTRCMNDIVQTCDANATWKDTTNCTISNQVCLNGQCEAGACTNGDTRCMNDIVQTCDTNATWNDTTNCANEAKVCSLGSCVDPGLCPIGQDCIDVTGTGYLGCTDGGYIPAGQTTGCDDTNHCPANETCMTTNNGTVCVANCGTCGSDLLCMVVGNDGTKGCLDLNGFIPPGETGCAQNGCTGNATCWCLDQDCTDSTCVDNCTLDGPCTTGTRCDGDTIVDCVGGAWTPGQDCSVNEQVCFNGACASSDLCPTGQSCDVLANEITGCLQDGTVPGSNQEACGQDSPCNGNFSCWCTNQDCTTTACIENCGICTDPLLCKDITSGDGTGTFACTETDGSIPANAQTGCQNSNDCTGNASCWCLDANCTDTVCLFNCSTPH